MMDRAAAAGAPESGPAPVSEQRGTLGAHVFRAGWISLAAQATQLGVRLLSTMVLARLLTPDVYGLVAMVAVVTGFIGLFKSLGLSTATIQAPRLSHAELNGLFWLNAGLGLAATIVATAAAPLMAIVYAEPRVTVLIAALSATFLIGGLGVQHHALLCRQMRFGAIAGIETSALAIGTMSAIVLASRGAEAWALVCGSVITEIVSLGLKWRMVRWRPTRPGFDTDIREMVALGRDLTQFNVLNYWARNLDNFLIGRFWGAAQLGLYNRAYQLLLFPMQQITTPLSSVAISALSRMNGDDERYRQAYVRLLEKVALACLPMTAFLFLHAFPVVTLVLGPKWIEVAPVFLPLAAAGMVQPILATFIWMLVSQGRRRDLRRWSVAGTVLSCGAIVAGLPGGIITVAIAYAACEIVVRAPLLAWVVTRRGPVRIADVFRAIRPGLLAAAAVAVACRGLLRLTPIEGANGLALAGVVALAAMGASLMMLPSGRRLCADLITHMRPAKPAQETRVPAVLLQER